MKKKRRHSTKKLPPPRKPLRERRPETKLILLYCPTDLVNDMDELCDWNFMNRSQIINMALKCFIEQVGRCAREAMGEALSSETLLSTSVSDPQRFISGADSYLFVRPKDDLMIKAPKLRLHPPRPRKKTVKATPKAPPRKAKRKARRLSRRGILS